MTPLHKHLLVAGLLAALLAPARAQTTVQYYPTAEEFVGPFPSWKNIKTDYGAKGDGLADDTAAIQKALNDMSTVQTNNWSVLYFPAGTYRITKMLTTSPLRKNHNSYLGSNIVGEDPATTTLRWDGPPGAPHAPAFMFRLDAWFCKLSRLTFDGRNSADHALVRAGGFSTYCELSDLVFKDIKGFGINLGNGETEGQAEHEIVRCKFFNCGEGVATINWNSLDIYVWYCLFQDCGKGITNRMGGYQSYENVFLRSKDADVSSGTGLVAFVNNTSIGSKSFLNGTGQYMRGNKIYDTTEPLALAPYGDLVLLDNVIRSKPGAAGPVSHLGKTNLAVGNTFTVPWPLQPPAFPGSRPDPFAAEFYDNTSNDPAASPPQPAVVQLNLPLGAPKTVVQYAITSGSDPHLDPRDFALQGSAWPSGPWTTLDARKQVTWNARRQKQEFPIAAPRPFGAYRLVLTANASGTRGMRLAQVEFLDAQGANLLRDKSCLVTGRYDKWERFMAIDQKIVDPAALPTPTTVRLPATPLNLHRRIFEVPQHTGDDAKAFQAQIDAAAREPAGSNPVVHLAKGDYALARTVTVPALNQLQIIGDGVGNGTTLNHAAGKGPMLLLQGPSRVTLRDLDIRSPGHGGTDVVVVQNADQPGGRIYAEQLNTAGNGDDRCGNGIYADGLVRTDVTTICGNLSSFLCGVKSRGAPGRESAARPANQVVFLTGGTGGGCRILDVADGGSVVGESFWYEGDWNYAAALLDLTPASSGRVSLAGVWWHKIRPPQPEVSVNGFNGIFTALASKFGEPNNGGYIHLTGDGSKATVFFGGSTIYAAARDAWVDRTEPPAQAVLLSVDGATSPSIMNKVPDALPDPALVRRSLEQLRSVRIAPAQNGPPGVTDVKLFRVFLCAGAGKDCLRIEGANPTP